MIKKDIDQITEEDLQALIDNSVLEIKTIEYKQSLPSNSESAKKEFLADVSSFANARGGDIIYGMVEAQETGTPKTVEGLIRDGIEPRIPSVSIQPITLKNTRVVLIIRVPRSWISPHRVTYQGHDKFYSRSSNGKYPLDVAELRTAFNLSETIIERIRKFSLDRISKILANETPVPFYDTPKIVLRIIPIISFNPVQNYDIKKIASRPGIFKPMFCSGWNNRYNLDGFLSYSGGRNDKSHSYVQLFRNGIIESVEGLLLEPSGEKLIISVIKFNFFPI